MLSIMLLIVVLVVWSPGAPPQSRMEGAGTSSYLAQTGTRRSLLPSGGKESVAPGPRDVFTVVEQGLAGGQVDRIAGTLDTRVFMQLRGSDGGYHSATQAYAILSAFLKTHKPGAIVFSTYGETDGAPYATGVASYVVHGVREDLQIYVALRSTGTRWVVTHLNMY